MVERFNQTLQNMLVKYIDSKKKDSWHQYLDTCVFSYNTSRHESTKHTPFQIMFNRRATLPIDVNLRDRSLDDIADEYDELEKPDLNVIADKRIKLLAEAKSNRSRKLHIIKNMPSPNYLQQVSLFLKMISDERKGREEN